MKSSEGYKLISDFDYDREPVLDPPYTAEDCAKELEVFPRAQTEENAAAWRASAEHWLQAVPSEQE